jgi:hypothetical protein
MSRRTIQSPGIEIREIDLTTRAAEPAGTSVFLMGFSNQGPTDEIIQATDFSEFENIFGTPTNAAERYFYHSAKQVFNSNARVFASRLPYGASEGLSEKYTAMVYPTVSPRTITVDSISAVASGKLDFTEAIANPPVTDVKIYLELVTKDINGDIKYTSTTIETLTAGTGTYYLTGGNITSQLSSISADTLVKGIAYTADVPAVSGYNSLFSTSNYFIIGEPTLVELTQSEYNAILDGDLTWSDNASAGATANFSSFASGTFEGAGLVVLNTAKTTINNNFEGYYLALGDNSNFNPSTNFDGIQNQYANTAVGRVTPGNYFTVPSTRQDYALSAASTSETRNVSRTLEEIPQFNIQTADFLDTIALGMFKVRVTPFSNSDLKLTYFLAEGYTGSLNSYRKVQNPNGGPSKSFYLEDVEDNSPTLKVLVNPFISTSGGDWTTNNSEAPGKFVRTHRTTNITAEVHNGFYTSTLTNETNYTNAQGMYAFGTFKDVLNSSKNIGSVPDKIDRVMRIASNIDLFDIDISIEAGLGTIWVNSRGYATNSTSGVFDDTLFLNLGSKTSNTGFYTLNSNMIAEGNAGSIKNDYRTIFNKFENFARLTRQDHIFIGDVLRNILVQGENSKVLDNKTNTFSKHVYWPIRHQLGGTNSNYACCFSQWSKVYDGNSGKSVWIPFSGTAALLFAETDANFAPWYAPAGSTRGLVRTVDAIAFNPSAKQRDQLYNISINPVAEFPEEGIVVYGQKTLQKKPSAFDRVNVRRLFLALEKSTRKTMKSFVFEPNTFRTRNNVVTTLTPIFENAKQNEGVYDYVIVCDDRNNPGEVIDRNELKVDIYLKPVRAAEFILVNFYAVNTDVNFAEIIG